MAPNHVALTAENHKNLKIRRDAGYAYAAEVHAVPVVLNEFSDVTANCPIIFVNDEGHDRLRASAMLGLDVGKNLFVDGDEWLGTHIPMNLGRVPYSFMPLQDGSNAIGAAIDVNSDIVSEEEGEPLFTEAGEPTDYLKNVNNFLASLFQGEIATQKFIEALQKHDMLREFKLQMVGEDGKGRELVGLFTISPRQLQTLSDEAALELHKEGHLAAAHMCIQSMSQVRRLVKMYNEVSDDKIRSVNLEVGEDGQSYAQ